LSQFRIVDPFFPRVQSLVLFRPKSRAPADEWVAYNRTVLSVQSGVLVHTRK
jgi:hypothetical protein